MKQSALYRGQVRHRRYHPKIHAFRYKTFMYYFDIAKIPTTFAGMKYCSIERFNWQSFRRQDYLDGKKSALDDTLRRLIQEKQGFYPDGEIYLLTQLACFGYCFNPISVYLIFDKSDASLSAVVLEVTNTPWGERHHYILPTEKNVQQYTFKKVLHVSPLMDMDYEYHLYLKLTNDKIILHLENKKNNQKHFDATLLLKRLVFNERNLKNTLFRLPFCQYKISFAIYWQALRLWLKGVPFCPHPKTSQ